MVICRERVQHLSRSHQGEARAIYDAPVLVLVRPEHFQRAGFKVLRNLLHREQGGFQESLESPALRDAVATKRRKGFVLYPVRCAKRHLVVDNQILEHFLTDTLKLPRYKKPYEGRRVGVDYARNGQKRASLQPDGLQNLFPESRRLPSSLPAR